MNTDTDTGTHADPCASQWSSSGKTLFLRLDSCVIGKKMNRYCCNRKSITQNCRV